MSGFVINPFDGRLDAKGGNGSGGGGGDVTTAQFNALSQKVERLREAIALNVTAGENLSAGSILAITSSSDAFKANASSNVLFRAVGLAKTDTAANNIAEMVTTSVFYLPDWTAIVGSVSLTSGSYYYLSSTSGMMSNIAPNTAGVYSVQLGMALTSNHFQIDIQPSILL